MQKFNLLGVCVCATTYAEATEAIRLAAAEHRPLTVTALAVHGVMTGALNAAHRQRLNAIDIVLPDGQPVRWGLNMLHRTRLLDRVCGPNITLDICRAFEASGLSLALYGSRMSVLDELKANLLEMFPRLNIVAAIPSRFGRITPAQQALLAQEIAASGADAVLVGLGCPRQEVWLFENRTLLSIPAVALGAAFDFHARRVPRAPLWMQASGLEWLFRLVQDPQRLWRRYILLNPLYLAMVCLQMTGLFRFGKRAQAQSVIYEGYA